MALKRLDPCNAGDFGDFGNVLFALNSKMEAKVNDGIGFTAGTSVAVKGNV
jgi:hypothetical protein